MRGTILGYDAAAGEGVINSDHGRAKFTSAAWKGPGDPTPGRHVDYDLEDGRAVDVYALGAGTDPANGAMVSGVISISCAILTFLLGPFGILTLIPAIVFGIKGKNEGALLEDKTAYYLSVAGLLISFAALLIVLLALAACVGVVGLLSVAHFGWQ